VSIFSHGRAQLRLHGDRHVHLRRVPEVEPVEPLARDADHGERMSVDDELAAEHVGLAAEPRAPVVVAEDGDRRSAHGAIVGGLQRAADRGGHTEHLEERARDHLAVDALAASAVAHVHRVAVAAEHAVEHRVVIAEVRVHRIGELRSVTHAAAVRLGVFGCP
jgi:hypothetical protein